MQILVLISLMLAMAATEAAGGPSRWAVHAGPAGVGLLTLGTVLALVLLCLLFNLATARRIDATGQLNRRKYRRGLTLLAWLMVFLFAVQLFYFRWPIIPLTLLGLGRVPVLAELAVWLPFAAMLLAFWTAAHGVDVRLRLLDVQRRLAFGLPVYAPGGTDRPIWSLGQYLSFQIRFNVLLMLLPLLAILLLNVALNRTFDWLGPHLAAWKLAKGQQELVLGAVVLAAVAGVLVLSPPALAMVFSTRPLPSGKLLDGLHAVIGRAGARVRRILLWNTHGMVSNAAVMGLWGRLRYVMLSDGLLETLPDEQIEGVFGHELGHVVHHHIVYYLMFIAGLLAWGGVAFTLLLALPAVKRWAGRGELAEAAIQGGLMLAFAGGAFLLFGWVSRLFERQADLTGAQAIALGELAGLPNGDNGRINLTQPPHPGAAEIYAGALSRIADINGIDPGQRAWRHGSIASRVEQIRRLCEPGAFRRFRFTVLAVKAAILVLTGAAVVASAVAAVGH